MPAHEPGGELYVGYLPVPKGVRRALLRVVPALVTLVAVVGVVWGMSQRSPGTARWEDEKTITIHGVLAVTPYPVVFVENAEGTQEGVLLVNSGKHGCADRVKGLSSKRVVAKGFELSRDGHHMLELADAPDAIAEDSSAQTGKLPELVPVGAQTLRGEIVDGKCYLGAMKPGNGKTHKACATLCIRGGLPALFVNSSNSAYLVCDGQGGAIDPALLAFVADPVTVTGEVVKWGNWQLIKVAPKDVRRLDLLP